MSGPERYLVMASAILILPSTFVTFTEPSATLLWSHNCEVSKCLTLPRPMRMAMPFAADASVSKFKPRIMPKSANIPLMPIPIEQALTRP